MKRKLSLILCLAMVFCLASSAFAAEGFTNFKMTFTKTSEYQSIVSDTTSKAKVSGSDYARLYVYACSSSKNNIYKSYSSSTYVSGPYYLKTSPTATQMFYTSNIAKGARVYLKGRPDSSVASCTVTGEYGAG